VKHVIQIFDTHTEKLLEFIEIPNYRKKELSKLMGWQDPEDEIYCYYLSAQQLSSIEKWTSRHLRSENLTVVIAGVAD
jgi:hypothetical protein